LWIPAGTGGSGIRKEGGILLRVRGSQVVLGLASVLLGMLLVFQYRAGTGLRRDLPPPGYNELASHIERLEVEARVRGQRLEEEIGALRERPEAAKAGADYDEELMLLRLASGLYPLSGPGLEIVLEDSGGEGLAFVDPNLLLVHYDHLLFLVNELWVAGAEAVAVNGERVVAQTGFTCAGPLILAGTKRLAPPYVIHALGDPAALRAALTMPGGFIEAQIQPYGLGLTITEKSDLFIPAYRGDLVFDHARLGREDSHTPPDKREDACVHIRAYAEELTEDGRAGD
jgi:uncharacterized protein YlxW (UPF0749 family)